ncbi:hypothetical protein [Phaeocystidibacter marisrubri]|uniref:DUF4402 domain-containing protein n=1 Tax=Phaeocystidibacter marisrubri TaxID=1577780 RepID=A0A6L3ZED9_9FLAO|nr:hypothetical protein [Phaeocystidibacter marisrubri]KAB2815031.1 hypothetical protein F8C82_14560 [Phaeocystidibacter marisrubri]GGH78102.1 hypothetical protein GCM10011318_28820 [Phaeocystidibacter marisrubri]
MNTSNLALAVLAANFLASVTAKENNGGLNTNIVKEIQNGNIELQPGGLMHATSFAPGNQVEILEASNIRAVGKSDFQGTKLDPNTVAILTGLKVAYGVAADGTDVAAVDYDSDRDNLPAVFKNSVVEIKQDGKQKLRIPIARLLTQVNSDSQDGDIYKTPGFIYLAGDVHTEIRLLMPSGVVLDPGAGNTAYIRFDFEGFVTRTRS